MIKTKSFLFRIVIPLMLVMFWFLASLFLNNTYGFTSLVYQYPKAKLIQYPQNKIQNRGKIAGTFAAKDNFLGIITLRFGYNSNSESSEADYINFRIKENISQNWYYSNDYNSGAIENIQNFPFGFPVINDSKNKVYEFEIISLSGNNNNSIELNVSDPQLTTVHKYTKKAILFSISNAAQFITRKIITSFTNIDYLLNSTLYLIPLLLYLTGKKDFNKILPLPIIILLFTVIDIVFLQKVYFGVLLLLIVGRVISIKKYSLESKSNYTIAFVLLAIWLPLIYFNTGYIQNKLNIWIYVYLFIGMAQAIWEEKKSDKLVIKNKRP